MENNTKTSETKINRELFFLFIAGLLCLVCVQNLFENNENATIVKPHKKSYDKMISEKKALESRIQDSIATWKQNGK